MHFTAYWASGEMVKLNVFFAVLVMVIKTNLICISINILYEQ